MEWRNIWRGVLIGITDLIPGISGGTMAVILGIYHRLVASINGLLSRDWLASVKYLIPVGLGMVAGIFGFSRVMDWLLSNAEGPTYFFFVGLILGITPYLLRQIDFQRNFTIRHYLLLVVSIVLLILFGLLRAEDTATVISSPNFNQLIFLCIAGWLASTALVLPGVSGTFVFLLLGLYPTVIAALKDFNLPVILAVGIGVVIGIILTSKIITLLLSRFTIGTYAVVIGMVLGAAIVIFPGLPVGLSDTLLSIVTFALGLIAAVSLGKISSDTQGGR